MNGYIDDEVWFGDEITPESLRETLYGGKSGFTDDVHIRLNSYGGSCNAAVRMYDDIRAYPGNVQITVSGTAASAATVLSMAADRLEMTPGSLFMIHDPSVIAWGNERDLNEALNLLKACKESILNVYGTRCKKPREEIAGMMTATAWMDAGQALADGFIDGIAEDAPGGGSKNAAQPRVVNRKDAEAKVKAWLDRRTSRTPQLSRPGEEQAPSTGDDHTSHAPPVAEQGVHSTSGDGTAQPTQPENPGTPIAQLEHRLGLIMPTRR